MGHRLLILALGSTAIGVACITAAAGIGGRNFFNKFDNMDLFNQGPRCELTQSDNESSRSLAWRGDDKFNLAIPANVEYRRGQGDDVTVRGDAAILPHVYLDGGTLKLDCRIRHWNRRLDVTLPGRDFRSFAIQGSGRIRLADIDQPELKLSIAGSGDFEVAGKAQELKLEIAGSGDANLGTLEAQRVDVSIAGSGDAEVAPVERLEVNIAGSGDVTLRNEPREIRTHVAGSGRIVHPDGSVSRASGFTSRSERNDD